MNEQQLILLWQYAVKKDTEHAWYHVMSVLDIAYRESESSLSVGLLDLDWLRSVAFWRWHAESKHDDV